MRLYLEDVQALYDELVRAFGGALLETPEFELDGPDDLANLPRDRVSDLQLRGKDAYVFVNLGPLGASVARYGDAAESIVVAEKLRQILLGCRLRLHWLFTWWTLVFWLPLEAVGFVLIRRDEPAAVIGGFILLGVVVLGVMAIWLTRGWRGTVVYLRRRRDSRSFFKRNADTLIVTGAVSLVTAVVSVLLTYYLTRSST